MDATDAMASACDGVDEVEGAAANSSLDAMDATGADDVGGAAADGRWAPDELEGSMRTPDCASLVSKDRRVKCIVR